MTGLGRFILVGWLALIAWSAAGAGETYQNPIVPGNWSDAGVIRVGDEFYSTSSSFGWQPGIPISHSRDLVHWEYIGQAFQSKPEIIPGSTRDGVHGTEIGYNPNHQTFLIYAHNRLGLHVFWSKNPEGPYQSKLLGKLGNDPGFFADDDGRLYLVTVKGILWELEADGLSIKREVSRYDLSNYEYFEGADIYKQGEYYYTIFSDGGTRPHQPSTVSTLRARSLAGPWEEDPGNPVLFSTDNGARFQAPAHGALLKIHDDEWYVTYHAHELSHYSLGRQLCMQPIEWTSDDWWRPVGGREPPVAAKRPSLPNWDLRIADSDTFDSATLGRQWSFLTAPDFSGGAWSLTENPGSLRVRTALGDLDTTKSLTSVFLQRITFKKVAFSTKVTFDARRDNEAAGLHMFHDPGMNLWLASTVRDGVRVIEVGKTNLWRKSILATARNNIGSTIYLRIAVDGEETATFYYSADGRRWIPMDVSIYFGDSWLDLRNGRKGAPDLGWVAVRKRNCWTPGAIGLFAVRRDASEPAPADFDYFQVDRMD